MSDVPQQLQITLNNIAKEQGYDNHEMEIKPIDSGGANYSSRLFAITISSAGKTDLKLFAKCAVLSEQIRSLVNVDVYELELAFYTRILSKYRELEERCNIPVEDRLMLPKYYGSSMEHMNEVIVLEDLVSQGYQPFNRFNCYDWEYASKCISFLGSLHALSAAYAKDEPENFKQLMDKYNLEYPIIFAKNMLEQSIPKAIASTEDAYRPKLERYVKEKSTDDNLYKLFNSHKRIVLNHGDFRPNNIVHKKDKDGKLKVVVLDHQTIQMGNPLRDLVYFLICGSDEEFRSKHLHQMFDHYYEEFSKNLRRLGVDPDEVYTEEQYRKDIEEMLPLGLLLGIFVLPIITVDEGDAPKPTDGIDLDSLYLEVNERFRVRFNGLVKDYARLGML